MLLISKLILSTKEFIFIYVNVYVYVWVYATWIGALRGQKKVLDSLGLVF